MPIEPAATVVPPTVETMPSAAQRNGTEPPPRYAYAVVVEFDDPVPSAETLPGAVVVDGRLLALRSGTSDVEVAIGVRAELAVAGVPWAAVRVSRSADSPAVPVAQAAVLAGVSERTLVDLVVGGAVHPEAPGSTRIPVSALLDLVRATIV